MRKPKENKFWNKRNVVSLFFVLIMATSVLGMWKGGSNPTQSYNDYKFELDGNYFTTEVNGNTAKFHYLPDSVESLELAPEISQTLEQAYAVTLLFDPNDELIQSIELLRMELGTEDFPILLNKGLIVAVTNTSSLYPTLTATDCTSNTKLPNFIPKKS